ncbi:MAG: TolC family protein [Methylophaga sp.]|nr:TolC family protein [Methylophaga sp.]
MRFENIHSLGFCLRIFAFISILGLSACTHFQSHPLTEDAVQQLLQTPSVEQLTVQASKIKHPLLKRLDFNSQDGLSPDEAAILAVLRNPELRALRDQQGIVSAQLLQAGLLPDPQLSSSFSAPSAGTTLDTNNAFGIGLSWEITALIWRQNKLSAASKQQDAVVLNIAWQEWQFAQAAKLATYQLVIYRQQLDLLKILLQRLEDNRLRLQQAADEGLVTELQRVAAVSAKNLVENRMLAVEQKMQQQRQRFNRAIGLSPNEVIKLEQNITFTVQKHIPSYKQLITDIDTRRLDLMALKQAYQSQEERLKIAVLQQFPKISIGFDHARDNSNLYTLGFGVSITLPIFDRNQGQIALEHATRQQLFDQYSNRLFQARATISELLVVISSIKQQIESITRTIPDLTQLLKAYHTAIATGQADVLNYYNTWNTLTNKEIEVLSLKLQLKQAEIALEVASGRYQLSIEHDGKSQ